MTFDAKHNTIDFGCLGQLLAFTNDKVLKIDIVTHYHIKLCNITALLHT